MHVHSFPRPRFSGLLVGLLDGCVLLPGLAAAASTPPPPGKMVDLSGHRLHVDCRGGGAPTVVVENGLGDFSFDWVLVQAKVAGKTRMCTYDRAGYAWSEAGPMPRTFDQLNFELREALSRLGEKPPFLLVGHSFGGPVIRNFAALHPSEVAGTVLVDSVFENQRVAIQGKAERSEFARYLGRRSYAVRLQRLGLQRIQAIARENGKKGGRPPKSKEA